jgi:hypothetical protein
MGTAAVGPVTEVEQSRAVAARLADGRPRTEIARPDVAAERSVALPTVWTAVWRSRVLVWIVGSLAFALLGTPAGSTQGLNALSTSFGRVGNLLAAPAVRWDSIWYLTIAHTGYRTVSATGFFPLYPLLIHAGAWATGSTPIAGVLISLGALTVALIWIHRLAVLELGREVADLSVYLIAFGPLAFYLSAVYTTSLFLMLSAGTIYFARRGRWTTAGALGGFASLAWFPGVALIAPVVVMFLYGPRVDSAPAPETRWMSPLMPRFRPTRALLNAALIPGGTLAYCAFLWARGFSPLAFVHTQRSLLGHSLTFPLLTVWQGAVGAFHQAALGVTGHGGADSLLSQSFVGLLALLAALVILVGVFRNLPLAYGAYVTVGLLVPLSSPTVGNPFDGLARYEMVLFPLYMWLAAWAVERGLKRPLLLGCCVLLTFFAAQFATWHVVGSQLL